VRVLILGGYGFIGLAVARHLHAAGHDVTGLGRSRDTGQRLFPKIRWVSVDISSLQSPGQWHPYLENIDVVVNASGALQDGAKDDLSRVQDTAIVALVSACGASSVQRFVQISALGALAGASTEFMRSKARADEALKQGTTNWIILRPGLVLGPNAYGGSAFIRMLAAFPVVQPLALADKRIQTVALGDVARIVLDSVEGRLPAGAEFDLVEPQARPLRHLIARLREWLGVPPARAVFRVPQWSVACIAWFADLLGHLGWRSPLRSTAMRVVADEVLGDASKLIAACGYELSCLEDTLDAMPATLQERWFARLYLLMPIMVAVLAAFWIGSGAIALLDVGWASAIIAGALPPGIASGMVVTAAIVDVLLGLAILFRPWARHACFAMIVMTLLYLAAGSILAPALWIDPLGPFVKTLPAMVLALATSVVLEER
jgi:uncharacterized protein YbjT (DUF2867 family)